MRVVNLMQHYLVVIALGNREPQTLGELSKLAAHSGCSIVNSHMNRLGKASAITLMLTGTWNAIAKLEAALPALAKKLVISSILMQFLLKKWTLIPTPRLTPLQRCFLLLLHLQFLPKYILPVCV